jgi:hypothetical protein
VRDKAFSAKDVLDLYLHRGSFETVLADEDLEQDPDRWCSRTRFQGRNSGRSSASGCGMFVWNSDSTCLPLPCGPPNSGLDPKRRWFSIIFRAKL